MIKPAQPDSALIEAKRFLQTLMFFAPSRVEHLATRAYYVIEELEAELMKESN